MFAWYADLTVCDLVQSEIACSNIISWIKSISSPFWWYFIWRVRMSCWWWGGWVSSAFFHALQTRAHKRRRGHFRGVDIFTAGGERLKLVPQRNLACFWCSTTLIQSNSRKKGHGAKPDAKPHCIPSNLLTVGHCFRSEGARAADSTLWAKYREQFQSSPCPETCIICQEIQQLGGIISLSSPLCVPSFTSMRQKDTRTNSRNKRKTCVTLALLKGLIDIV